MLVWRGGWLYVMIFSPMEIVQVSQDIFFILIAESCFIGALTAVILKVQLGISCSKLTWPKYIFTHWRWLCSFQWTTSTCCTTSEIRQRSRILATWSGLLAVMSSNWTSAFRPMKSKYSRCVYRCHSVFDHTGSDLLAFYMCSFMVNKQKYFY